MTPAQMRTIVDQYIDAYNSMDIAAMLQTVHADVVFMNIAGDTVNACTNGVDELKALAEQSLPLFSERQQTILNFEAQETRAVSAIAFRAVLAKDLPNGLRQGQVLDFPGRSEFEFQDGLIAKISDFS